MKTLLIVAAALAAFSVSASAAIELTLKKGSGVGVDTNDYEILSVSQWGYFWNLQDPTGATRSDGIAGDNAYANDADDGTSGVLTSLKSSGNTDYSIKNNASDGMSKMTLSDTIYLNTFSNAVSGATITADSNTTNIVAQAFDISASLTTTGGIVLTGGSISLGGTLSAYNFTASAPSISVDFGVSGAIKTTREINFGQSVESFTFNFELSDGQLSSLAAGTDVERTLLEGLSNYGIWNLYDRAEDAKTISSETLSNAGYECVGLVKDASEIGEGQYGLLYTDNSSSVTVKLVVNAIPEPSAFGILAGMGALALAVSRRRRRSR